MVNDDDMITDDKTLAKTFNEPYINTIERSGGLKPVKMKFENSLNTSRNILHSIDCYKNHPSICKIKSEVSSKSFSDYISLYVSAYRKGYNSQHVLIRLLEERRQHLDNNDNVGGVFIDLSSAFDCLPHDLLIAKNWQHTLLMKICLCIYILIFQIESCAFVLIMYTAVSKMFFLGYLKGPLSSLNCLIVSLMIFFLFR